MRRPHLLRLVLLAATQATLLAGGIVLILVQACTGQSTVAWDVDDVSLTDISQTAVRLTWTNPGPDECDVTYSVFRSTHEDFTPSPSNRIASGLRHTSYVDSGLPPKQDYYYYVKAISVSCTLHFGEIVVYPMDLGQTFYADIGENVTMRCTAISVSELSCPRAGFDFHAVIASQKEHDYLIGCQSGDYESGAWTCVNLTPGPYLVLVHSTTLTFRNSGFVRSDIRTGKIVAAITPIFSVLTRIK